MGWSSGTGLFSLIMDTLVANVPDKETRKELYRDIIDAFMDHDWDNLDECRDIDPAYDEVYLEYYPDSEEEEEEEEDDSIDEESDDWSESED
jgi:hypothetical protein